MQNDHSVPALKPVKVLEVGGRSEVAAKMATKASGLLYWRFATPINLLIEYLWGLLRSFALTNYSTDSNKLAQCMIQLSNRTVLSSLYL